VSRKTHKSGLISREIVFAALTDVHTPDEFIILPDY
jgi:hypothetical protein